MKRVDVVIFDCLRNETHELKRGSSILFGGGVECDVRLSAFGVGDGAVELSRHGANLHLSVKSGQHQLEVDGVEFEGGMLPQRESDWEWSLAIDKRAFFLVKIGRDALDWGRKLSSSPADSWGLRIFDGGLDRFSDWKNSGQPNEYPGMFEKTSYRLLDILEEVGKRNWTNQIGLIHHKLVRAGFYASQFLKISKDDQIPDEGENRCPRCWMRFGMGHILAIHPSKFGDEKLGEEESMRFLPTRFDSNGKPLSDEGQPCVRLACPQCRGELPPNFVEKPPHMISIVGDSMAGKSYFLTVAVKQLQNRMKRDLNVSFTDGDPSGNHTLSKMVSKLFSPTEKPEGTFLEKTALAGATYKTFIRYGKQVKMPAPFTYNIFAAGKGASSLIFYDNAGEHFRPGYSDAEKSNHTEHIAWASGILFLFDPLQHSELLKQIKRDADPQVGRMIENASHLMFDQHSVLSEMGARIKKWKNASYGDVGDIPLALVLGKHDLLNDLFPASKLRMTVCERGAVSGEAIEENSKLTRAFLLEHCPDIVAAAEEVSSQVKFFPASAFGSPAVILPTIKDDKGNNGIGPDPSRLKPYLVEAPFYWLLSKIEPELLPLN